jgi:hypothetical protein
MGGRGSQSEYIEKLCHKVHVAKKFKSNISSIAVSVDNVELAVLLLASAAVDCSFEADVLKEEEEEEEEVTAAEGENMESIKRGESAA